MRVHSLNETQRKRNENSNLRQGINYTLKLLYSCCMMRWMAWQSTRQTDHHWGLPACLKEYNNLLLHSTRPRHIKADIRAYPESVVLSSFFCCTHHSHKAAAKLMCTPFKPFPEVECELQRRRRRQKSSFAIYQLLTTVNKGNNKKRILSRDEESSRGTKDFCIFKVSSPSSFSSSQV